MHPLDVRIKKSITKHKIDMVWEEHRFDQKFPSCKWKISPFPVEDLDSSLAII